MVAEHDCAQAMGVKSDLEGRRQSTGSLAHCRQCGGKERAQRNEQQAVFAKEYAAIVEADLFQIYDGILTLMKEKFDSEEDVACEIRCYTSETEVADVLDDATQGVENLIEIKKRRQRTVEEIVEMPVPQIHGQIDEVVEVICLVRGVHRGSRWQSGSSRSGSDGRGRSGTESVGVLGKQACRWDHRGAGGRLAVGNGWTQTMFEQRFLDCDTMGPGCDGGRPMVCTSMDITICRRKFVVQMVSSSRSPSERHWGLGKMTTSSWQGGGNARPADSWTRRRGDSAGAGVGAHPGIH